MSVLIKLACGLWVALAAMGAYTLLRMATERSGPEGRGLGGLAAIIILVAPRRRGRGGEGCREKAIARGLILMTVILAWPLVFLIVDAVIKARRAAR